MGWLEHHRPRAIGPPVPEPEQPPPGETGRPASSAAALQRKALISGAALVVRTIVIQLVILGGNVVLARRLQPGEFGAYAIVQFTLTFLTVFGDAGLGGALIQRKDPPTQQELSSVFWLQGSLGLAVLTITWAMAGWITYFIPDLPAESPWLLRILAVDFFVTSLRVVPSILMERELKFVRLSVIDTAGNMAFYLIASLCALQGVGLRSLSAGVIAQMSVTFVLAYALMPWRPSLAFSYERLRPLMRFGLVFQLKFVLGLALNAITPLWGGYALGARSVGLINWAQNTAYFPLRLVDIVSRVSFPLYSRLNGDQGELTAAVERSIRITAFGTLFFSGLMLGLGLQVTEIIYSAQWLPALPLLYVYASAIGIGFLTPVLATVFDALGDPATVLKLSLVVTVGIWATVVPASLAFGPMGFVVGYVSWMVIGNVVMMVVVRRRLPAIHVPRQLLGPFLGAVAMAAVARWGVSRFITGPVTLAAGVLACAALFLCAASVVDPKPLRDTIQMARGKKKAPDAG